jgi:hypothetical protein
LPKAKPTGLRALYASSSRGDGRLGSCTGGARGVLRAKSWRQGRKEGGERHREAHRGKKGREREGLRTVAHWGRNGREKEGPSPDPPLARNRQIRTGVEEEIRPRLPRIRATPAAVVLAATDLSIGEESAGEESVREDDAVASSASSPPPLRARSWQQQLPTLVVHAEEATTSGEPRMTGPGGRRTPPRRSGRALAGSGAASSAGHSALTGACCAHEVNERDREESRAERNERENEKRKQNKKI